MALRGGQRPLHKIIFSVFDALMAIIYLAAGAFFVLFPQAQAVVKPPFHSVFGGLLLVYGLYRLYRAYDKYQNRNRTSFRDFD